MVTAYQPNPEQKIAERIYQTPLPGLLFVEHTKNQDERGFFKEIALLPDLNIHLASPFVIKQINHAHSEANVVRGFHAESWRKLIWLTQGTAFCVLVDVRPQEASFGQAISITIGENGLNGGLMIPAGLANSVCVVKSPVDYTYCYDSLYRDRDPGGDQAISLFDPDINVSWPIRREDMIISSRDQEAVTLRQRFPEKFI